MEGNGMFQLLKKALLISRPAAWPFAPVVYAIGVFASGGSIGPFNIMQLILLTFPLSFFVCGINDVYDIQTDKTNKRKGTKLWGAIVSENDVGWIKKGCLASVILIMLSALASFNFIHIISSAVFLLISYIYSAPPLRLKSVPVFDSLISGVGAFSVFLMGYSLSGNMIFDINVLLFFLTASAAHAIGTIMDVKEDRQAGIRTFATAYGPRLPAIFAAVIMLANIPFAFNIMKSIGAVMIVVSLLSIYLAIRPTQDNARKVMWSMLMLFILWTFYALFAIVLGIEQVNVRF